MSLFIVSDTTQFVSNSMNKYWSETVLKIFDNNDLGEDLILIEEPNSEKLTKGNSGAPAIIMVGNQPKVAAVVSQQYWDKNTLNILGGVFW